MAATFDFTTFFTQAFEGCTLLYSWLFLHGSTYYTHYMPCMDRHLHMKQNILLNDSKPNTSTVFAKRLTQHYSFYQKAGADPGGGFGG